MVLTRGWRFSCIEGFYSPKRWLSRVDNLSPADYEKIFTQQVTQTQVSERSIEQGDCGPRARVRYRSGTITGMATNLRLRPEAEEAVRAEAQRSGRSQQDIIRDAVDRYLGLPSRAARATELHELLESGTVLRPRVRYRKPRRRLRLPDGVSSAKLLDRADRL